MRIQTPVEGFTGEVVGVHFVDGFGETEDENAISYFIRQGFGLDGSASEDVEPESEPEAEAEPESEPEAEAEPEPEAEAEAEPEPEAEAEPKAKK